MKEGLHLLETRTTKLSFSWREASSVFTQKLSKIINHDADALGVFYKFPPRDD